MKFYLSSFKVGSETEKLLSLAPASRRIGFVANAMDSVGVDPERRKAGIAADIGDLTALGFSVEPLNLRDYFGKSDQLAAVLDDLSSVWVRGGNVFVLRQAMKLSGFDAIIRKMSARPDFLYAGYSAGCCVLSEDLSAYSIVDDPNNFPYPESRETIWGGLGFLPFAFLPHYDSDHFESAEIDKEIKNCIEKKILFKALRDGEVLIFESGPPEKAAAAR